VYEGLLEKNAADTKSGAGQYFTPRALISAMVDVMRPAPGMTIADPACGTGGFLLAAHDHISDHHGADMDRDQKRFLRDKALRGVELVDETARLCAMNLFLHGIGGADMNATPPIEVRDSLLTPPSDTVDMVLANPPFGREAVVQMIGADGKTIAGAGADAAISRQDFWASTANKQLNFVQHIRSMVKIHGSAAVVVPDNVLFEEGAGETIRRRLLHGRTRTGGLPCQTSLATLACHGNNAENRWGSVTPLRADRASARANKNEVGSMTTTTNTARYLVTVSRPVSSNCDRARLNTVTTHATKTATVRNPSPRRVSGAVLNTASAPMRTRTTTSHHRHRRFTSGPTSSNRGESRLNSQSSARMTRNTEKTSSTSIK
jgi:hypothetical protein